MMSIMTEKEMQQRLYQDLRQDDLRKMKLPFSCRSKVDNTLSPSLEFPALFCQKDFLTHKINQTKA